MNKIIYFSLIDLIFLKETENHLNKTFVSICFCKFDCFSFAT